MRAHTQVVHRRGAREAGAAAAAAAPLARGRITFWLPRPIGGRGKQLHVLTRPLACQHCAERAHTHTHRHTHARTLTGQPWAPLTWPRGADLPPDSQDPNCSLSLRLLAQCQLAPSAGAQSWHLSLGLSARSQRYSHWRALNFARSQVAPTRACWLAGPLLPLGRRSLVLLFRRPPLMLDGSNTLACVCARRPKRTVCRWRLSQLNGARELSRRASE